MRFSSKSLLSGIVSVAAFASLISFGGGASVLAQSAATPAATASASTNQFPPCPAPRGTPSAEATAAPAATDAATMAATVAATASAASTAPGYLGIIGSGLVDCGIIVNTLLFNGGAVTSDMKAGDIIIGVDGVPVTSLAHGGLVTPKAFYAYLTATFHAGDSVTFTVERGTQQTDVAVTLAAMPVGGISYSTATPVGTPSK